MLLAYIKDASHILPEDFAATLYMLFLAQEQNTSMYILLIRDYPHGYGLSLSQYVSQYILTGDLIKHIPLP